MVSAKLYVQNTHDVLTGRVVRWQRVHHIQCRWYVITLAFTSEDDVTLPVGTAVRVNNLRVRGIDDSHGCCLEGSVPHFLGIRKTDLLNDGRLVKSGTRGRRTSILDEEDFLCRRVPSHSLVENGIRL